MIRRPRPYAPSGVALAFVLALVIAAPSWGDRPQETPGVPPGTPLPGTAQAPADAGPPSWTGKAFREGVVAVSHPLAAEAGAGVIENGGNAIRAPRISVTSAGGFVSREAGFSDAAIAGLQALGHSVGSPAPIGSVQAVVIDLQTGKQYGGADSRREGTVIGLPRPRN